MIRTFPHSFDPPAANPVVGSVAELEVSAIEDAGLREVLQTPGAAYGAWSVLDALLSPTGAESPFRFREPLGQAREVKVALSGLFGRFVARAYLERYFGLTIFAHLGSRVVVLDGRREIKVERLDRGDLPDWIACKPDLSAVTIAEAKGCHDPAGPSRTLGRAWKQAARIDLMAGGSKVAVKRIAVATRWGVASSGSDTLMSVKDPFDDGDLLRPGDEDALFLALTRRHAANLIRKLGHAGLAGALDALDGRDRFPSPARRRERASALLDGTPVKEVDHPADASGGLVGGIVVRTGPITDAVVAPADQDVLARLNLRPVFVGIERDLLRGIIDEDLQIVRKRLAGMDGEGDARSDRAGGWVIRLGEGRHVVGGV